MKINGYNTLLYAGQLCILISCGHVSHRPDNDSPAKDSHSIATVNTDTNVRQAVVSEPATVQLPDMPVTHDTIPFVPDSLVAYARTLKGVHYLYASTDPAKGLDCSGFITCVFNHFKIKVPRSSVDFTNYGKTISVNKAKPGDLILFTGTDSTIRIVGHMGIVESIRRDTLYFIHSSSGKAKGVVISPLGKYYLSRFVKTIRVFPDEWFSR